MPWFKLLLTYLFIVIEFQLELNQLILGDNYDFISEPRDNRVFYIHLLRSNGSDHISRFLTGVLGDVTHFLLYMQCRSCSVKAAKTTLRCHLREPSSSFIIQILTPECIS